MRKATVKVPLRLDALAVDGFDVQRSGIRWLCADGHRCRRGEVVAWCNIGLAARPGTAAPVLPFQAEARDFQVAFAVRQAGRLIKARGVSRGGLLDQHEWNHRWSPDTRIGHLVRDAEEGLADPAEGGRLRMLFLAGRRTTELAEVRWGPATGWHDRARAWWADGPGAFSTLLSLGICEQIGLIRGERGAFLDLFARAPGPAQVVFIPDDVLVPSVPVLRSQLQRTPAHREQIVEDLLRTLGASLTAPGQQGEASAASWLFAGCLLKALNRSPLVDSYEVLTSSGPRQLGPANVVLLSLHSEQSFYLRHKRLGYALSFHEFRLRDCGPGILRWLQKEFEAVFRSPQEVLRDYRELVDSLRAATGAHLLILNAVATTGLEDVNCYAAFDRPLAKTLASVRAKELNLVLYQLARERDVTVVDVDALAVELGVKRHILDGVHASGRLQGAIRRQVLTILRERKVPGFGPAGEPAPT